MSFSNCWSFKIHSSNISALHLPLISKLKMHNKSMFVVKPSFRIRVKEVKLTPHISSYNMGILTYLSVLFFQLLSSIVSMLCYTYIIHQAIIKLILTENRPTVAKIFFFLLSFFFFWNCANETILFFFLFSSVNDVIVSSTYTHHTVMYYTENENKIKSTM